MIDEPEWIAPSQDDRAIVEWVKDYVKKALAPAAPVEPAAPVAPVVP